MRFFPAAVILSWPTPNYVDPVTRGLGLVYINSVLLAVAIIISTLRLYTRLVLKRWFGADDAFLIIALIMDIGFTSCIIVASQRYGWDRHIYDIPFTKWEPATKLAFVIKLLFVIAAGTTRLSFFALYYRLSHGISSRCYRWFLHSNAGFTVAFIVVFTIASILDCVPVSNYWDISSDPDTCVNEGAAVIAAGSINSFLDFLCTITPIPLVANLSLPLRQRVALVVLFSLGFVVTGAGIVRCYYSYKSLIAEYDVTWYSYPLWIAGSVEIHLGIICASVPPLRPLLAKIPFKSSCSQSSDQYPSLKFPSWFSKLSTQSSKVTRSTAQPEPTVLQNKNNRADAVDAARAREREATQGEEETQLQRPRACHFLENDLENGIEMHTFRPQTPELGEWGYVERCRQGRPQSMDSQRAFMGSDDGAREIERVAPRSWLNMPIATTNNNTKGRLRI